MDLPTLLLFTKRLEASDLHLSAGAAPMVRLHGEMRRLEIEGIDLSQPSAVRRVIYGFLTDAQKKRLEADWELDCAIEVGPEARFRANVFLQQRGLGGVFRVVATKIPSAQQLGLPPVFLDVADLDRGLVLVTGPTGSGKSTTLAALIDHINRTRRSHIITIEDPIEFVHPQKRCMINQREVRSHTRAFANALRSALREDPDVILVGELRDPETIGLAITAAETGHLVFGTLHTSSAAQTVDRIINVFPAGAQAQVRTMLAESLQAVISQVLLKKKTGGRAAAHEVLLATSGARSMIREEKNFQLPSIIQTGQRFGMCTLEQSIAELVRRGVVEPKVAEATLAALRVDDEDGLERTGPRRQPAAPYRAPPPRRAEEPGAAGGPRPPGARADGDGTPIPPGIGSERNLRLPRGRRDKGEVVFVLEGASLRTPESEEPGPLWVGASGAVAPVGPDAAAALGAAVAPGGLVAPSPAAAPADGPDPSELARLFPDPSPPPRAPSDAERPA